MTSVWYSIASLVRTAEDREVPGHRGILYEGCNSFHSSMLYHRHPDPDRDDDLYDRPETVAERRTP